MENGFSGWLFNRDMQKRIKIRELQWLEGTF